MQRCEVPRMADGINLVNFGEEIAPSCRYNQERECSMATASPAPLFQMQQLFDVVARSVQVFGSTVAAVEWFETANTALNQKTPFEELTEHGPAQVETLIGRIEHGVYS